MAGDEREVGEGHCPDRTRSGAAQARVNGGLAATPSENGRKVRFFVFRDAFFEGFLPLHRYERKIRTHQTCLSVSIYHFDITPNFS